MVLGGKGYGGEKKPKLLKMTNGKEKSKIIHKKVSKTSCHFSLRCVWAMREIQHESI